MVHAFDPSIWEAEAGALLEFEASLVYRVSSRTAKATQRNPVSKKKSKTNKTKKKPRLNKQKIKQKTKTGTKQKQKFKSHNASDLCVVL